MKKKIFNQIGLRDLKITDFVQSQIDIKDHCPYCGYGPLNGVSKTSFNESNSEEEFSEDALPEDGCPSICFKCGEFLIFHVADNVFSIEKPSDDSLLKWKSDFHLWNTLYKIQKLIKNTSKPRF